jgi:lipoprotein signal peptidase
MEYAMTVRSWQKIVAVTSAVVVIIDQISKFLITAMRWPIVLNEGISFGWRPTGEWLTISLLVLIVLVVALSYRYWSRAPYATGLFLSGLASNMADRFMFGGVRDWLLIPLTSLTNNLADWAIALSVSILIYQIISPTRSLGTTQ